MASKTCFRHKLVALTFVANYAPKIIILPILTTNFLAGGRPEAPGSSKREEKKNGINKLGTPTSNREERRRAGIYNKNLNASIPSVNSIPRRGDFFVNDDCQDYHLLQVLQY